MVLLALCFSIASALAGPQLGEASLPQTGGAAPEHLRVAPAAHLRWGQIVRLDLELSKRGTRYTYSPDVPPEPVFELDGPLPGPAPHPGSAPARSAAGSCAGHAVEPPLSDGFLGLPDNGQIIPPDTMGSVGPAHVVTMLNGRVRIRNRVGGILSTVDLTSFWSAVGGNDVFDPKLLYDHMAGRWVATVCADRQSPSSRVLFAISATDDPTGTWTFYSFDGDAGDTTWVDFPGLGFNSTWFAISMNMFTNSSSSFQGIKLWAVDRATALAGGTLALTVFPTAFDLTTSGRGSTMAPCLTYDPGEATLYLVYNNFTFSGVPQIRLSRLTGTGAAPSWSVVPGSSNPLGGFFPVVNVFGRTLSDAPQLDDPRRIDTNDTRVLSAVVRNGSVWFTHSGDVSGGTAVYWYEVDPGALPAPIVQSGFLFGGNDVHHFFPSLAVNCAGDVCLGFSRADAARYVEAVYAVRLAGDALGSMGPVRLLKAGEDWYFKDFATGRNRWGDYSSTVVDPIDDTTFWTLQEFADQRINGTDNGSRWGTWWGRIGSCGQPTLTDVPDSDLVCEGTPVVFSVSATASNAPLAYQWRKDGLELSGATGSTLTLPAPTLADAGLYEVEVRDGCGVVLSPGALLSVLAGVQITTQPASREVCVDQQVVLAVTATGPGLTYQWRKDGNGLGGETAATLTIACASLADAGAYDVVVTAASGCTATSAIATLGVTDCKIRKHKL